MEIKRITHDPNVRVRGLEVSFAPAKISVRNGIVVHGGRPVGTTTKYFTLDPVDIDRNVACYVCRDKSVVLQVGHGDEKPKPPAGMFYKLFRGTIPAGESVVGKTTFTVKTTPFAPASKVVGGDVAKMAARQTGMAPVSTVTTEPTEPPETDGTSDSPPDTEPEPASETIVFPIIDKLVEDGATTATGRPTVDALREALQALVTDEVNGEFRDLWWGKYEAAGRNND